MPEASVWDSNRGANARQDCSGRRIGNECGMRSARMVTWGQMRGALPRKAGEVRRRDMTVQVGESGTNARCGSPGERGWAE